MQANTDELENKQKQANNIQPSQLSADRYSPNRASDQRSCKGGRETKNTSAHSLFNCWMDGMHISYSHVSYQK